MALHGLGSMTLGVPRVGEARAFYREFGLTEVASGSFASHDGGEQLRVVERPVRQLVDVTLAADNADDLARIASNAAAHDLDVTHHDDGSISVVEPIVGVR